MFLSTLVHLLFTVSLVSLLLLISGYSLFIPNTVVIVSLLISGAATYLKNRNTYNAFLSKIQKLMMMGLSKQYRLILQIFFIGSLTYLFGREIIFSFSLSSPLVLKVFSYPSIPNLILWVSGILLVLLGNNKQEKKIKEKKELNNKLSYFIFFLIVALGSFLRIYKLDAFDIRGDEFQVVSAAAGYLYIGDYYRWNWIDDRPFCLEKTNECYYDRAWPHTWMVAQSFKHFGISEASARIPSVVFGIFFILISYPIGDYFLRSKKSALLITTMVALNPAYIDLSRYARMYIILLPVFLCMVYCLYRGFWGKFHSLSKLEKKLGNIQVYFPYHYGYILLGIVLLWFNYHVHLNSLIIVPVFFLYAGVLLLTKGKRHGLVKRKALPAVVIGIVSMAAVSVFHQFRPLSALNALTFFERDNSEYFNFIFGYPTYHSFLILILFMGLLSLIKNKLLRKEKMTGDSVFKICVFLFVFLSFSTIFFVYIADRYSAYVYASHITYFSLMALILSIRFLKKNVSAAMYSFLICVVMVSVFVKLAEKRSDRYDYQGTASFSKAYQIIVENYNPETQALFLQYPRDFYLQGLSKPTVINMQSNKRYTHDQFLEDLSRYESGYIAWETGKSGHLQQELRDFIRSHFIKHHGAGLDTTQVEVFYFNQSAVEHFDNE